MEVQCVKYDHAQPLSSRRGMHKAAARPRHTATRCSSYLMCNSGRWHGFLHQVNTFISKIVPPALSATMSAESGASSVDERPMFVLLPYEASAAVQ